MRYVRQMLADSASRWRISTRTANWLLLAPIIGFALFLLVRLISLPLFRIIANEDGVVEWAQVALLVVSIVFAARIAANRFSTGHPWQAGLFVLVTLFLVLVAGEEISWGQRLLGFDTPEELEEINEQGEFTLHNIGSTLSLFNLALLAASAYATLAEPIGRRLGLNRRWRDAETLLLPPIFLGSAFGTMAAFRLTRILLGGESSYMIKRTAEWAELCFYAALALFLVLAWRRLRAADRVNAAASGDPPG